MICLCIGCGVRWGFGDDRGAGVGVHVFCGGLVWLGGDRGYMGLIC